MRSVYEEVYTEDRPTDDQRPTSHLGKFQMDISTRGRPINFMFGSTMGFSKSADRMALFPVWPNSIGMWEKQCARSNLKYFLFVVDSVCLSQTLILLFLFLDGIEPFLGHQFSMTKTTKRCSYILDLLPWQRNLGYFLQKHSNCFVFVSRWNRTIFLAISSPWPPLQNVVLWYLI